MNASHSKPAPLPTPPAPEEASSQVVKVQLKLREMILQDRWRAGDALPGERDLAGELDCSRASLREALSVLEAQGIIDSRAGGRSTVRATPRSAYGSVLELQLTILPPRPHPSPAPDARHRRVTSIICRLQDGRPCSLSNLAMRNTTGNGVLSKTTATDDSWRST